MQRQTVYVFGGQQYRQHTAARHTLFDHLRGFVCGDRGSFAVAVAVDLANVFDHADLHRPDIQLFADFLANAVCTATAGAGQLVPRQFVDEFAARQVCRQRLALPAVLSRRD